MSRTFDLLHVPAQIAIRRAEELAKPEAERSEAVLACCALFESVTKRDLRRAWWIRKQREQLANDQVNEEFR